MIQLTDKIASVLLASAKIRSSTAEAIIKNAEGNAVTFALLLIRDGYIDRDVAGEILGHEIGSTYINLSKVIIVDDIVSLLPADQAIRLNAIPIYKLGEAITVSIAEPNDSATIAALGLWLNAPISPMFSFPDEIDSAVRVHYQTHVDIDAMISKLQLTPLLSGEATDKDLSLLIKSKPIVEISDAIVLLALRERASDIHIEAKKYEVVIRYRIDGTLHNRIFLPIELSLPLISRYKILANLDISEHRKSQDGRFSFALPDKTLDVRVSSLPTIHGEKIVMRILGSIYVSSMLNIDKLDISQEILRPLKNIFKQPHGIFFVTGPTGSGKSTTLYAALNYLATPEVNIVTIEDPVEFDVDSLNQVMVNEKAGRTFATTLRSVLRQDPDIILVGETRDPETARIALQSALTGHLVLSSLHTNDAIQASVRLIEMGVESFLVAPALLGVIGQRLVKRICEFCKVSYTPSAEDMLQDFYWREGYTLPKLCKGEGCEKCHGTGYFGRIAIHEFLIVTQSIREGIIANLGQTAIRRIADQEGFRDMRYDGFKKVLRGLTTLEEIRRAVMFDVP